MENKLLLNIIEDRYRRFQDSYSLVTTDFLDLAQCSAAAAFVKKHSKDGVFFYGGYDDAERRQIVFMPDYLGAGDEGEAAAYFRNNPGECPIAVLEVKIKEKGAVLRHSDYLGSLLALGIKREKTGDIMVNPGGAHIFVSREIAGYLAENYLRAGRAPITAAVLPISEAVISEANIKRTKESVPSARLDNIVGAAFGVSRKSAVEAINRGLVFVDNEERKKPDYFLKGGEKIVLRGKGKAVYRGTCGVSRKGKLYAEFDRYI